MADTVNPSPPPRPGPPPAAEIGEAVLRLALGRGAGKTVCPSEVARSLRPDDWRPLMGPVRRAAVALAREGRVEVLRKGRPADLDDLRGVIRIRIAAERSASTTADDTPTD